MAPEGRIAVVVAYAPGPRQVWEMALDLPLGSTVAHALASSDLLTQFPELNLEHADVGVWGRKADRDQLLRVGDRVEVYRPLRVDPKVARRERFVRQGARSAGLFAQRRPGAKAGY